MDHPLSDYIFPDRGFLGNSRDYQKSTHVLIGAPMDWTVSFRSGTRFGPNKVREVSYGLEMYSPYLNKNLNEMWFYDAGNLYLPFGNVMDSLTTIHDATAKIVADHKIPVLLGGEHLVSSPAIAAVQEYYPELAVIHFDAHADLRETFWGESQSHATVMRRAVDVIGPDNLYQFGIRSGDRDEFEFGRQQSHMVPFTLAPLTELIPKLAGRPVYISLDIDVLDPAYAPGTGTPEPGGCSSMEILQAIHDLRHLSVVGFDLVEVSPPYDQGEITSLLAAKIVREALLGLQMKSG